MILVKNRDMYKYEGIFGHLGVIGMDSYDQIRCPYCHGTDIVKSGIRHNKSGDKQLYKCKACNRRFTPDDGFLKMRYKGEIIAEAISCYRRGMSLRAVSEHLRDWRGVHVSHVSVLNWTNKYGKKLVEWDAKQSPEIKGPIHSDEIVIKVKGKKNWYWGSKDKRTRYRFIGPLTEKRSYEEGAKVLYQGIKKRSYESIKKWLQKGKPIKFVSDKLAHYRKAFNKFFRGTGILVHGVPIACKKKGLKHNNNPIERDNERIRQRTKTMRGFKNPESAQNILGLFDVCHNYIDEIRLKGEKRARTPAQRAKIKVDVGESQRLLNLIKIFFNWSKYPNFQRFFGIIHANFIEKSFLLRYSDSLERCRMA